MSARATNATVEFTGLGLKLRGTVTGVDPGGVKRTPVMNGDKSHDHTEEWTPSMLKMDLSMVANVEVETIRAMVDQPAIVKYTNGQTFRMTLTTNTVGEISDGKLPVEWSGPQAKQG